MPSLLSSRLSLFAAVAVAMAIPHAVQALDVISFNAVGATSGGMTSTDVAGAPGVSSTARWNNMFSLQTTGGMFSGSLAAGSIFNSAGATINLMTLTWSGTGVANAGGSGTGSQKMFESEWDLFDSGGNTSVVDMTFTLTNVPYANYDVYFYVQDANGAASTNRGGDVTANGLTKSIKMFPTPADISGGSYAYVESDSAFTFNASTTALGTYLRIPNVTGNTLTLTISSKNASTPRLRMSGFQVVEAIPEPGVAACLIGALTAFTALRRPRDRRS